MVKEFQFPCGVEHGNVSKDACIYMLSMFKAIKKEMLEMRIFSQDGILDRVTSLLVAA